MKFTTYWNSQQILMPGHILNEIYNLYPSCFINTDGWITFDFKMYRWGSAAMNKYG